MFPQQQTHVYVNIQQVLYITELLPIIFQLFRYQLHRSTHFLLAGVLGNPVVSPESDNDARTQVLENIQDAMYEDGPFIVIAQAPAHIAHSTRLDGVDIFDSYTIDLTAINVK